MQYNVGLLPDIILLTQCYFHRGTRLNAMKRFCTRVLSIYLQPLIRPLFIFYYYFFSCLSFLRIAGVAQAIMLWHMLLFGDAFGPAYTIFWCFCIQLCFFWGSNLKKIRAAWCCGVCCCPAVQLAAGHGVTAVLLCVMYVCVRVCCFILSFSF